MSEAAPPPLFLLAALYNIAGYRYGRGTQNLETDCCRYVEAVIRQWKKDSLADYDGSRADLNVWDGARPWSPAEACEKMGIAVESGRWPRDELAAPGVYLCQGWRELNADDTVPKGVSPNGHTFFIWIPNDVSAKPWKFEATTRKVPWSRPVVVGSELAPYHAGVAWARLG